MKPIAITIIEDQREIREGLAILIDGSDGYRCASKFGSVEDALEKIGLDLPDVALIDIGLPGMSGIEGISILKAKYPDLVCLVLSIYEDDERIFDALCAGACGYLLKKTPPTRLLESIRDAANGGSPISPDVASRVIKLFRQERMPKRSDSDLTPHEMRLLKLLVEGHSYKTAAAELKVSVNTISFHIRHIYEKLQVHSKSEAVAKAINNRLI
jgi:DNA-binding NarL/FixJ family response regulator